MPENLKNKLVRGATWSLVERFGYLSIQFITNIVLARLLVPEDFGTMGVLLVFINLSLVLIDGGLANAIIQKKFITEVDKSTVFYTNLILAIIIYAIIFISSPRIAYFFRNQQLTELIRVLGLTIIIDAGSSIQNALIQKAVDFKSIARIKITAALFSTMIAIATAMIGLGVWSLVIQHLMYSGIRFFLLWYRSVWLPKLEYSFESFKTLFNYGYKLLLSTFLGELYYHSQSFIIGRKFSSKDLGYYTQAKQLQYVPMTTITNTINQVSFPVYSLIQDDKDRLQGLMKKNLKMAVFVNFPLMMYLSIEAKSIIFLLYGDKWYFSIPYFQYLCLGYGLLSIVHQTNLTMFKAIGKSGVILKLEILKKILGITFFFIGIMIWGIWGLMYALTLNSVIEIFINGYYTKRFINYGASSQLKDFTPTLLLSLVVTACVYYVCNYLVYINNNLLNIIVSAFLFCSLYLSFAGLFKFESFMTILSIVREKLHIR